MNVLISTNGGNEEYVWFDTIDTIDTIVSGFLKVYLAATEITFEVQVLLLPSTGLITDKILEKTNCLLNSFHLHFNKGIPLLNFSNLFLSSRP